MLERHKQFCKEYIYDWNATRAYMVIYPNSSENSAGVQSSNLIRNNRIKAYIKELQKDIEKQAFPNANKWVLRSIKIGVDTTN